MKLNQNLNLQNIMIRKKGSNLGFCTNLNTIRQSVSLGIYIQDSTFEIILCILFLSVVQCYYSAKKRYGKNLGKHVFVISIPNQNQNRIFSAVGIDLHSKVLD